MMELTAQPPLDTICPEIVNMVLESVEVHDGGLLHFYSLTGLIPRCLHRSKERKPGSDTPYACIGVVHFLDGTVLEIETEEE